GSGTIDARFCAWRTPGGVKSVILCELSVPGAEARCRANHGSARCSRAGATAGGRTEMRGGGSVQFCQYWNASCPQPQNCIMTWCQPPGCDFQTQHLECKAFSSCGPCT